MWPHAKINNILASVLVSVDVIPVLFFNTVIQNLDKYKAKLVKLNHLWRLAFLCVTFHISH